MEIEIGDFAKKYNYDLSSCDHWMMALILIHCNIINIINVFSPEHIISVHPRPPSVRHWSACKIWTNERHCGPWSPLSRARDDSMHDYRQKTARPEECISTGAHRKGPLCNIINPSSQRGWAHLDQLGSLEEWHKIELDIPHNVNIKDAVLTIICLLLCVSVCYVCSYLLFDRYKLNKCCFWCHYIPFYQHLEYSSQIEINKTWMYFYAYL